jgi:hypothetical protein
LKHLDNIQILNNALKSEVELLKQQMAQLNRTLSTANVLMEQKKWILSLIANRLYGK